MLLKLGRTAHFSYSRFKLPIPCDTNSTRNIMPRSASTELIRQTRSTTVDCPGLIANVSLIHVRRCQYDSLYQVRVA